MLMLVGYSHERSGAAACTSKPLNRLCDPSYTPPRLGPPTRVRRRQTKFAGEARQRSHAHS